MTKKKSNVVLDRVMKSKIYEAALERAPEEDREKIVRSVEAASGQFNTLIEKLFVIAQDPKLSALLREELLRIAKNPMPQKEVTEDGES